MGYVRIRPQLLVVFIAFALSISAIVEPPATTLHAPQTHSKLTAILRKHVIKALPLPPDCSKLACLALTFDDGPNPVATPIILQALEQAHVPATFFVVGNRAATMPSLLQQMNRDGDEIGNHSWSHPDMTSMPAPEVDQQIAQTEAAVSAAGVPAPTVFRPPYGYINATMQTEIHMPFIMWNDDSRDWANHDPNQITQIVESEARAGGIVELHDIYASTGQALPQLLPDLQAHYTLVTISQLLALNPSSRGEFYNR